jgi:hypothetical protein
VRFDNPAELFADDPIMGGKVTGRVSEARMGDILRSGDEFVNFEIDVAAGAPIERIEIRNRTQVLETWRPWTADQLGRRVRIIWEGSEYRGRGRQSAPPRWKAMASKHSHPSTFGTLTNASNAPKTTNWLGQR